MATNRITKLADGTLAVPDQVTIPFIIGDGIGPDIWRASVRVFDAAVEKAYNGKRKVDWKEVLAGENAFHQTGEWLPEDTLVAFREHLVGIKGPLTTPIGGGIRSLNVAIRKRSEEHTSELQSLMRISYAVFCLKKKKHTHKKPK